MLHVALFGIHKLLIDSLTALHRGNLLPDIVIFPQVVSAYHHAVVDFCKKHSIRFLRPKSVNDPQFINEIRKLAINRIVVTGYNEIFCSELIALGSSGAINCHGGLMPEERGPVPYKWAIYDNRESTGATYHQMTEKLDRGKIYVKNFIKIGSNENSQDLFEKICIDFCKTVPLFFISSDLGHWFKNESEDNLIKGKYKGQIPPSLIQFDLSLSYDELSRRVRAFSPRPGVFFKTKGQTMLVKKISNSLEDANEQSIVLQVQDGNIAITEFEIIS